MDIDSLPEQLDYLRPVIQHYASFDVPNLSEALEDGEVDTSILEEAVLSRVGDSRIEASEKIIRDDLAILGEWLSVTKDTDSTLHFVHAWMMMGATQLIGVKDDNVAFLSKMLANLPKAPPGREFGPTPEIEPVQSDLVGNDGNLILYVQKHSFGEPQQVDICISVNNEIVAHDIFEASLDNKYTRYCLKLDEGEHQIMVTSKVSGAKLEKTVAVGKKLYACIMFFYSPPSAYDDGEAPWFFFQTKEKDWLTKDHWKSP